MTFTDDDLKRLKEFWNRKSEGSSWDCMTSDEAKALFARLEAAEATISDPGCNTCCDSEKYNAWRKAAGRTK